MAQPTAVPQHVTALLSHLTSRPGVQSTFILSRRDGSIIQGTGLLAADLAARNQSNAAAPRSPPEEPSSTSAPTSETSPSTPTSATQQQQQQQQPEPQEPGQQRPKQQKQAPYQPTHAEALAAHIFAFVSSASDLSMSLSHPPENGSKSNNGGGLNGGVSAEELGNGVTSPREEGEHEGHEKEEDDEVKLLRLRTKKHEIVVVPDRKYLLCVVHDAAHSTGGAGSGGVRSR